MKKILFLIILCLVTFKVNAKTYYSNYSNYFYQDEKIENSDTVSVKELTLYKWYHEEIVKGEYIFKNEGDFVDLDDFKIVSSIWLIDEPLAKIDRVIEEKVEYHLKKVKPFKYVKLEGKKESSDISEVKIYKNNQLVTFDNLVLSDDDSSTYITLNDKDILFLKLDEEIFLEEFKIEITFIKATNQAKTYIYLMPNETDAYFKTSSSIGTDSEYTIEYLPSYFALVNPEYMVTILDDKPGDILFATYTVQKLYKTIDTLYRKIDVVQEFLNDFQEEGDDYYNKQGESKTVYKVKKRDKITIDDDLVITDKNFTLDKFIQNSTTADIKIISNIDMNVNGKYKVIFLTPFKKIEEEVIVDVKENLLNALVLEIEENNKLRAQVNDYAKKVNAQNVTIKEIITSDNEKISSLQNELLKTKNSVLKNEVLEENTIDKKRSHKKIIPLIFLSIVAITVFMFKKLRI